MTGPGESHDPRAAAIARLTDALSELDPADQAAAQRLLASMSATTAPWEPPPAPSRRHPRRDDVVTYRVRVDVAGTKPPLWRRLELASDLFLDDLHGVIQAAFGWTDGHLHGFGAGRAYGHPETEHYLCPFEVEEGSPGVPEEEVRLDEVLVDVGDRLFYLYDFGDGWEHVLRLEAVLPREPATPRAVCTKGRRDGPPEDCGGVYGYELISAATDPTNPDHTGAVAELARVYGDDVDSMLFAPTPFDLDEINAELTELGSGDAPRTEDLPEPLGDLLDAVRAPAARQRLRRLVAAARLDQPVSVEPDIAARMLRPYAWLLERVGEEGITLTGAGYLPPADVEAAVQQLGLGEEWIGKGNREHLTAPVWHLRESARAMGLVRKHRGRLLLTRAGRALGGDPVGLWWHVAERMPPSSDDLCEQQAGALLLLAVAAHDTQEWRQLVAELLDAIGWVHSDGTRLTGSAAVHAARHTWFTLGRIDALPRAQQPAREPEQPTPEGVTFARAALRSWPDAGRRG